MLRQPADGVDDGVEGGEGALMGGVVGVGAEDVDAVAVDDEESGFVAGGVIGLPSAVNESGLGTGEIGGFELFYAEAGGLFSEVVDVAIFDECDGNPAGDVRGQVGDIEGDGWVSGCVLGRSDEQEDEIGTWLRFPGRRYGELQSELLVAEEGLVV